MSSDLLKNSENMQKIHLGWREWVSLPELGLPYIKAKVDTGARTSALHTFDLDTFHQNGKHMVRFRMHPMQKREDIVIECTAELIDRRWVSDSGGHRELRHIISTPVRLGQWQWPIEITLTNRDSMRFRMLLGRTALRGNFVVEPDASYLVGKPANQDIIQNYYHSTGV